jgi:Cu(I)/Ag(I) efflux system membrane fusion protein
MTAARKRFLTIAVSIALFGIGAWSGWWWASRAMRNATPTALATLTEPIEETKVLYWYDPMRPDQHFDEPGKSPFMDMELVPKYAEVRDASNGVRIDPRIAQNLGLRRARVSRIPLVIRVDATGVLAFKDRDVSIEQVRVGGFVERVWPLAVGDIITVGQPIVELLVPEWRAAELEYLAVMNSRATELMDAARGRLAVLGMTEEQIQHLELTRQPSAHFVLKSSRTGMIQSLEVRNGMTVMAGQTLIRVNGLQTVWVEVAVPEASMALISTGSRAELTLSAFPGEILSGRVTAILPALSETTRSVRVRVELPNPEGRLRPGMSAQVGLLEQSEDSKARSELAVPSEAVIRTGKRALVMRIDGEGGFAPVEVTLGQELGDQTEIKAGLAEGETVVASAQFLLDSDASLRGVFAVDAGEAEKAADERGSASEHGHYHHGERP